MKTMTKNKLCLESHKLGFFHCTGNWWGGGDNWREFPSYFGLPYSWKKEKLQKAYDNFLRMMNADLLRTLPEVSGTELHTICYYFASAIWNNPTGTKDEIYRQTTRFYSCDETTFNKLWKAPKG